MDSVRSSPPSCSSSLGRFIAPSGATSSAIGQAGKRTSTISATKIRYRVDRDTVSERDWLAYLDDQVEGLHHLLEQHAEGEVRHRAELDRRIRELRDELRAEVLVSTRQGWQLVLGGLTCSAVGTGLSMLG